MKVAPLSPGVYICRFNHDVDWDTIKSVIINLNDEANPCGVHFIPEKTDCYQIEQVEENNT